MITIEVDPVTRVAVLKPQGLLTDSDLEIIKGVVDPYIDEEGALLGLIIQARQFPNWESFEKVAAQLDFADQQHEKLTRVAVVTDSEVPKARALLQRQFSAAEVRHFAFNDLESAAQWVNQSKGSHH